MNYWDNRYQTGGTSGCGSIGELRDWKWGIIKKYNPELTSVIDIGCGDMRFWDNQPLPSDYTGIDISETIIKRNKQKYPEGKFNVASSTELLPITSDSVFCLDMLFHIMEKDDYIKTLENCCIYSKKYIFIYTWLINPLKKWIFFEKEKDSYERYYDPILLQGITTSKGFSCIAREQNTIDKYGAMFIFKKL
jgi:ubiquinone/menaquinone biosynthesis C-methylase UbiE